MSAPLLIKLSRGRYLEMAIALGVTYALSTALFTYSPLLRGNLAIVLSLSALVVSLALEYIPNTKLAEVPCKLSVYGISAMAMWAFLDANLFETLSRTPEIAIWRMNTWPIILVFHLIGMATAYALKEKLREYHSFIIAFLFALSYALYALNEPLLLSMVYPFVISYYNFIIIKRLIVQTDLKRLGLIMVFTGWIAGGAGLMSSLIGLTHVGVLCIVVLVSVETYVLSTAYFVKGKPHVS